MLMSKASNYNPFPMFDFSQFTGGDAKRPVDFIGLTAEQTGTLLLDQYGISRALMEHYPDVVKRGDGPNAVLKSLIVFEHNGRDCTYEEIGQACNVSADTAYQQMTKARKWVQDGLKIKIEHSGERLFMVTNESLAAKAERLDAHMQKAERVFENLKSDVDSIRQSGQTPVLPGKTAALLGGYEQMKATIWYVSARIGRYLPATALTIVFL